MKLTIVIFPILIFIGCSKPETKKVILKYDNGQEEIVHYIKDMNDTSTYRKEVFYKSGKHQYTGNIIKNVKEGTWIWWYENGNKKDQCKYLNGKDSDTIFHWYENGKMKQQDIVLSVDSNPNNSCTVCCNIITKSFYENGNIKMEGKTIDDKRQGKWIIGYENGGWKTRTLKDDKLSGVTNEHQIDSAGNIILVVGQFENDKESGLWKWFDKDSVLCQTAVYENGIYNGAYIEYYKNGKIKSEGVAKNGSYEGIYKAYDEKGNLIEQVLYKDGQVIPNNY